MPFVLDSTSARIVEERSALLGVSRSQVVRDCILSSDAVEMAATLSKLRALNKSLEMSLHDAMMQQKEAAQLLDPQPMKRATRAEQRTLDVVKRRWSEFSATAARIATGDARAAMTLPPIVREAATIAGGWTNLSRYMQDPDRQDL